MPAPSGTGSASSAAPRPAGAVDPARFSLRRYCQFGNSAGLARRRHDTLLRHYLGVRGFSPELGPQIRELYWLAGACNALAGALRYHLSFAVRHHTARVRFEHACAVRDWFRIVRRAEACWTR